MRSQACAALAVLLAAVMVPAAAQPGQGPLDISSDDQEFFEAEGRAVFTGNVNAIRGDTRLRSDRAEVFFTDGAGGSRQLSRIEARGDVFYVTPTETARSDRGLYEVEGEIITMIGDVVLTQGCNVSTGQRLVANLQTGVSRLFGSDEGQAGGRVRSLFFSEDDAQARAPGDCPMPVVPGPDPLRFDEEAFDEEADIEIDADSVIDRLSEPD